MTPSASAGIRLLILLAGIGLPTLFPSSLKASETFSILSSPRGIDPKVMTEFLLHHNSLLDREKALFLSRLYYEEAHREGVNHEIAFAQMCLETGFLSFGGQVSSEQNNFCGLGALDSGVEGAWFASERAGVRAHIQHLKAYASPLPLLGKALDPRYHLVQKGSAPTVDGLTGRWATDPAYGEKIKNIMMRLYSFKTASRLP